MRELETVMREPVRERSGEPEPTLEQGSARAQQSVRERAGRPHLAGPLDALLRHPLLSLLPIVALAGGAVFLGLARDPEYTAHARIKVGRDDVPAAILQNAAYGNQIVALSYARAIGAPVLLGAAARTAGVTATEARHGLTATLVPESTLIDVQAKRPSETGATSLANAGATSLISYIEKLTRTRTASELLHRYRTAQAKVRQLQLRVQQLQQGNKSSTRLARAQLDVDEADLRATQLANIYRAETTADVTAGAHLTLLAPAADAKSDRGKVLEELIIIAVAAGLVLGVGIALLRTNWRMLRAHRA